MITEKHLHDKTPQVLARLQQLVTLPDHGTVAGQAVASILFEELGLPIKGPINDVDVFVNKPKDDHQRIKDQGDSEKRGDKPKVVTDSLFLEEDYKQLITIASRQAISIHATQRDGLLNTTFISSILTAQSPIEYFSPKQSLALSQELIEGFDINAVEVGINLTEKTLVFSQNFLNFCNSLNLKSTTAHSPTHTLIRLAKKREEIQGVKCDFEREKQILIDALFLQQELKNRYANTDKYIDLNHDVGPKFQAMHAQFDRDLPPLVETSKFTEITHTDPNSLLDDDGLDRTHSMGVSKTKQETVITLAQLDLSGHSISPSAQQCLGSILSHEATTTLAAFSALPAILRTAQDEQSPLRAKILAVTDQSPTIDVAELIFALQGVKFDQNLWQSAQSLLKTKWKMIDEEITLFFHRQKILASPAALTDFINLVEKNPTPPQKLITRFGLKADDVFEWFQNPSATYARLAKKTITVLDPEHTGVELSTKELDACLTAWVQQWHERLITQEVTGDEAVPPLHSFAIKTFRGYKKDRAHQMSSDNLRNLNSSYVLDTAWLDLLTRVERELPHRLQDFHTITFGHFTDPKDNPDLTDQVLSVFASFNPQAPDLALPSSNDDYFLLLTVMLNPEQPTLNHRLREKINPFITPDRLLKNPEALLMLILKGQAKEAMDAFSQLPRDQHLMVVSAINEFVKNLPKPRFKDPFHMLIADETGKQKGAHAQLLNNLYVNLIGALSTLVPVNIPDPQSLREDVYDLFCVQIKLNKQDWFENAQRIIDHAELTAQTRFAHDQSSHSFKRKM